MPALELVPLVYATWDEYIFHSANLSSNPPKQSIMLGEQDDVWRFVNVMGARLSNGKFGSKTVYVDEATGKIGGDVLLYDANGDLLVKYPAGIITPFRCAIMTAMTMDVRYMERTRVVGLVGMGEIGVATASVLDIMSPHLKIDEIQVVASRSDPLKNSCRINYAKVRGGYAGRHVKYRFHSNYAEFGRLTTLITATNNVDPDRLLHRSIFGYPPLETISHDTGWLLGPSFRRWSSNYTDHVEQFRQVCKKEFPFDEKQDVDDLYVGVRGLQALPEAEEYQTTSAYLYGIALSDLVVAEALHKAGLNPASLDELLSMCSLGRVD